MEFLIFMIIVGVVWFAYTNTKGTSEPVYNTIGISISDVDTDREGQIKLLMIDIRDDLYTASQSNKMDDANIYINRAKETYNELLELCELSSDELKKVEERYNKLLIKGTTGKYINQIHFCLHKIKTLKTKKSKDKYYALANEHIKNAKNDLNVDMEKLQTMEDRLNNVYESY